MPVYAKAFDTISDNFGDPKFTQISKLVDVAIAPGGFDLGVSTNPQHTFRLQGSEPNNLLVKRNFKGGKTVKNINVADNTSIAGVTLTINGVVYTIIANGGTPTTYEIEAGADAAGTETNINAKLNNLQVTKRTKLTSSIVSGQVKVTGSDKEALTIVSSNTNKIAITSGTGTSATALFQFFANESFIEGTPNVLKISCKTELTDSNKPKDDKILIATLTPASISTPAELIAAIKVMFTHAFDGTSPLAADGITELGYINSELGRTKEEISAGLQAIFGTDVDLAFTSTSTTFTLNILHADYLGLPGNGITTEFGIFATEPDCDIVIDEKKTITINDVTATTLHSIREYNSKSDLTTGTVPQDNAANDYSVNQTGTSGSVSFGYNDIHKNTVEQILANAANSMNSQFDILMPGGGGALPVLGVAAIIQTPIVGKFHFEVCNIYPTAGADFKGSKSSTDAQTVSGNIVPRSGVANVGIIKYKLNLKNV